MKNSMEKFDVKQYYFPERIQMLEDSMDQLRFSPGRVFIVVVYHITIVAIGHGLLNFAYDN